MTAGVWQARAVPPPAAAPPSSLSLLADGRWPVRVRLREVALLDRTVAAAAPGGGIRRAEVGSAGPLLLEAHPEGDQTCVAVWGPAGTPPDEVAAALDAAAGWAGVTDDPRPFAAAVAGHPVLGPLLRRAGEVRLSRLPRVGEALGRSVLGQLVQGKEAWRSSAQLVCLAGPLTASGLRAWPDATAVGRRTAAELRRCGVSLRGARALHAAAVQDRALAVPAVRGNWPALDARLRALPGVGAWTSAETRLLLGDGDAVSVGDYHLPSLVGAVLTGRSERPRASWTDDELLALLEPFAGHRGRAARLCEHAAVRGWAPAPPRRAPRRPLSAHRYW